MAAWEIVTVCKSSDLSETTLRTFVAGEELVSAIDDLMAAVFEIEFPEYDNVVEELHRPGLPFLVRSHEQEGEPLPTKERRTLRGTCRFHNPEVPHDPNPAA